MQTRIAIIGAGGFAREVAWLLQDINAQSHRFDLKGFLVSDLAAVGPSDSQERILGDFRWLETHLGDIDALVFGIGNPAVKRRLSSELLDRFPKLEWPTLIHPSAHLDLQTAKIGKGVVICSSVIATVNITFHDFSMINLNCTIGHEAIIGRYSVLNPAVNISGGVELGSGSLIGTGAQILQYVKIGDDATVGAGAVVSKDVSPNQTVVGIPARPRP